MNNAEIIKGIDMTIAGLTAIKSALGEASVEKTASKKTQEVMNAPVVEEKKEPVAEGTVDVEKLNSMKYNEFKKYAAQLGVDCKGTRDEIMQRVLALGNVSETAEDTSEEETEEVVEETSKSDKPAKGKKFAKKEADEPTTDEFDEQAKAVAEETDVEDIIEALSDVGVKATKKNAVEKLAEALRKGLIELDEDEEDDEPVEDADDEEVDETEDVDDSTEDDEEGDDSEDEDEDFSADSYFSEYDPDGFNNPEDMTDERAQAIEAKMQDILDSVEDESLTVEDIQSYLEDHATEAELDLLGDEPEDEECLKLYMELVKRTIDNDGDEHEPSDPYEVGDDDLCCGHKLKYSKKTKKYICEICGTEYEAE